MPRHALVVTLVLSLFALPAAAQKTPEHLATAYDALADTILAMRTAEMGLVKSILAGHRHRAEVLMKGEDWNGAAAEMALFASEGDNAIGGIRKRLLEGGHHFNAAGEEAGTFEDGYVVVTRAAKKKCLDLSSALRQATTDEQRKEVWEGFAKLADKLLKD